MTSISARIAWSLFGAIMFLFLLAPALLAAVYSIEVSRYFRFPPGAVSLAWYVAFFASGTFRSAMAETAVLALVATPICLLLALPTAHALARFNFGGRRLLNAALLSPLIVPGVVTGVAFLSLFRIIGLDQGLARMTVAMIVVCYPFALRALSANYAGIDPRGEEAARDLGAGPFYAYSRVTVPQLRPGLLAAAVFVFVEVVDNFSVNVFLVDLHSNTLPIAAYQHIRDFDDPLVAVMSTLLSLLTLALVVLLDRVVGAARMMR